MKNNNTSNKENYCIWMEGGLVAYKVCDLDFECDACPLDDVMRKKAGLADKPPLSSLNDSLPLERPAAGESPSEYFERRLDEFFQPLISVKLPDDRLYHRCHMWVKKESETSSTIGIDHIGTYFLQPVVSVVLPQTPSRMERKSPCTWLVLREGTIALRSAVQGIATAANDVLLDHPYLLLDDPYNSGWILRITRGEEKKDENELLTSQEFTPIFLKEASGLKERFASSYRKIQPNIGSTLRDGGEAVKSIQEILGHKKYFEIISRIFSKT